MSYAVMLDWPNVEDYSEVSKLIRIKRAKLEKQIRRLQLNQPVMIQLSNGYWNGKNIILKPTEISNSMIYDIVKAAPDDITLGEVLLNFDEKNKNEFGEIGYDWIETEEVYFPKAKKLEWTYMGEDVEPNMRIYIPYSSKIITDPTQIYREARKFMTHCKESEYQKLEKILGLRRFKLAA